MRVRPASIRLALVALLVAVTGTACTGGDHDGASGPGSVPGSGRSGEPKEPPSAYDLVLAKVKPDGTVNTATALAAFSLAVAPLPGVAKPAGPTGPISSGTAAVRWILAHWADLTAAQRKAVTAALTNAGPDKPAAYHPGALAAPEDPDLPCLSADSAKTETLRPVLDAAIRDIAAHLGRALTIPVRLSMNNTQLETVVDGTPARMYTYACRGKKVNESGRPDGCTIHVNPVALTQENNDHDRQAYLTHEAMHCYLMDKFGTAYDGVASWLAEGIPMWVQTTLTGGDAVATKWWHTYLELDKKSLFARSYDAIGFYVQLARSGVDVWQRLDPMTAAYLTGRNTAAWAQAKVAEPFLRTWASGHVRGDRDGADWDITGNGIPSYWPDMRHFDPLPPGTSATAAAPAAGVDLIHFVLPAESIVRVSGDPSAHGLFGLADGDHPISELGGKTFCAKQSGCACPQGSPGAGADLPAISEGPGYLGVTGGLKPASVTIAVSSLADYCAKPADCLVGSWTITGSHLQSTGSLAFTETGGAGARMIIVADGATTIDFSPMKPVLFAASDGLAGDFRYFGKVSYKLGLPNPPADRGVIKYLGGDLSKLFVTARVTKPFKLTAFDHVSVQGLASDVSGISIDTQPLGGDHTYDCTSTTLVLRPPAGGSLTGSWTFARAA